MSATVGGCPVCGSDDADATWMLPDRYYDTPGMFEVHRCRHCRATFVTNPPDDISAYYGDFYYSYSSDAPPTLPGVKGRLKRWIAASPPLGRVLQRLPGRDDADRELALAKPPGNRRILDIGCGSGQALDVYRSAGWATYGIELGDSGAAAARAHGHNVITGDFGAVSLPWTGFDLVRASHVIEHVTDPMGALRKAAAHVGAGGCLFIELPNLDGWLARLSGQDYWQLDPPRHLAIPTPQRLAMALRDAGFDRIADTTYSSGKGIAWTYFFRRQRAGHPNGGPTWRISDRHDWVPRGYRCAELAGEVLATVTDAVGRGDNLRIIAARPAGAGAPV